ncbi:MAG TPA: GNAT family N-acetyltransferase [Chloroflexaceae bacterium]|nr:GNAT family N-acetyltransferase [Chloroflexaceae bacterium]
MNQEAGARVIHGERVTLRPWQRGDTLAQELWPRYSEPFSSLWNIPRSFSYDDLSGRGWGGQRYAWAVDDRQRRLIGRISLREVDTEGTSARLGISLAQPYVSQGLGTEALVLFLDHYFGPMGFGELKLDVAAFNRRAVRCYERLGFDHVESEWRGAGSDPALRLLDDPRFADLRPFFRRNRFETQVEFYEMALSRDDWQLRRR